MERMKIRGEYTLYTIGEIERKASARTKSFSRTYDSISEAFLLSSIKKLIRKTDIDEEELLSLLARAFLGKEYTDRFYITKNAMDIFALHVKDTVKYLQSLDVDTYVKLLRNRVQGITNIRTSSSKVASYMNNVYDRYDHALVMNKSTSDKMVNDVFNLFDTYGDEVPVDELVSDCLKEQVIPYDNITISYLNKPRNIKRVGIQDIAVIQDILIDLIGDSKLYARVVLIGDDNDSRCNLTFHRAILFDKEEFSILDSGLNIVTDINNEIVVDTIIPFILTLHFITIASDPKIVEKANSENDEILKKLPRNDKRNLTERKAENAIYYIRLKRY